MDSAALQDVILGMVRHEVAKLDTTLNKILQRIEAGERERDARFREVDSRLAASDQKAAMTGMIRPGTLLFGVGAIVGLITTGASWSHHATMTEVAKRAAEERAGYHEVRMAVMERAHERELAKAAELAELKTMIRIAFGAR